MTTLVEFLLARLAEDEETARAAADCHDDGSTVWAVLNPGFVSNGYPCSDMWSRLTRVDRDEVGEHMARFDPARVLREVESKRQLVHAHARLHECLALTGSGEHSVADGEPWELWEPAHTDDHGPCLVLRCLALPSTPTTPSIKRRLGNRERVHRERLNGQTCTVLQESLIRVEIHAFSGHR